MNMLEVGDKVTVNKYCYSNRSDGTEIVKNKTVECTIIKAWHDYECGWRYWAIPTDPYLLSRKDAHKPGKEDIIYVSEWDIIKIEEA